MAKTSDFLSNTSGKLNEQYYTRQTENGTILARMSKKGKARRSEKQANMRCQMPNAAANFKLFSARKLTNAFEGKETGLNDYNAFIQVNYGKTVVFITKDVSKAAGCVLANYQYSRGRLSPIRLILDQNDLLVTNVKLGALVIGAGTTVAEFSAAVMANNTDWLAGDQLTFFYGTQYVDSEGVPRAEMESWRMVLSTTDDTPLWDITGSLGFSSVNGYLGMSEALSEAGASWIRSREKSDGSTVVSTQRLVVVSSVLAQWQGDEAMMLSAQSYGGITAKEVYLNPTSTLAELMAGAGSGSGSSNGSGSTSGGSSTGGGSTGGNSGGNGGSGSESGGSGSGDGGSGSGSGSEGGDNGFDSGN